MTEQARSAGNTVDLERGTLRGRPRRVVRFFLLGLFKLIFRVWLAHEERVPKSGGVLVVANHIHNTDPVLISAAYPRPLHFMAKKEAFHVPIVPILLRLAGSFPVDRGKADRAAIRRAQAALNAGIAVGIFPEGTRSITRSLQQAHAGAGLLSLVTDVPVQPVVITGTERLPLNGAKGKLAENAPMPNPGHTGVRILFGEPFRVPRLLNGKRVTTNEATEIIMVEIARLLPPDYQGIYADALDRETVRRALPLSS